MKKALLAWLVLVLLTLACGSSAPIPTASPRCVPASQAQIDSIRDGIKDIDSNNNVLKGFAVRSTDFQKVWMVATEINGPGIKPKEAIGVWAISGELESPGLILSVDGFAKQFSSYPDASKTSSNITLNDDGVTEAKSCALNN